MKDRLRLLLIAAMFVLGGCAGVSQKENLLTLDDDFFGIPDERVSLSQKKESEMPFEGLNSAYEQVHESKSFPDRGVELPVFMVDQPLVRKIVEAAQKRLNQKNSEPADITRDDLRQMSMMLAKRYSLMAGANADESAGRGAPEVGKIMREVMVRYLSAYYTGEHGGYINRDGVVFKRSEVKSAVGNDAITAVVGIALEAMYDVMLETPIYAVNGDCKNEDGELPSVLVLSGLPIKCKSTVPNGQAGIEKRELRAIHYLSGLAGDQSKILSGAAFRAFGGVDVGFVVGGRFSFGDNDTLAKVLDTTFEVSSRRLVEAQAYKGFASYQLSAQPRTKAGALLVDLLDE